ncbi:MAG TPA: alpha-isopropylmalate synthase regulatory domain-containing protein, partial [Blastocatellia bacterium]|nr:alpha-isopropylmalate synthase regulatory domain-containing protein [Blastocatellia bacterium]
DLSGKSNILYTAGELGIDLGEDNAGTSALVRKIKELEHQGFHFEAAEGSVRLLVEEASGRYHPFFELVDYEVTTQRSSSGPSHSVARVRIRLDGRVEEGSADGSGPVHALDRALRHALSRRFECLTDVRLTDYKVRVLDADKATAARVRVLVQSDDGEECWNTIGVSENILDASWGALSDAINYKLLKTFNGAIAEPMDPIEATA